MSTDYKNYSQRNLFLAITQKLLYHCVQQEDYKTYSDFLENSETKENAVWSISKPYFESRSCIVSLNGTSNYYTRRFLVTLTHVTVEVHYFKK